MKPLKAEFLTGAAEESQFPAHDLPEIAFAGRSNVGKSSLLNSIVLRKKLAFISSTPGKTQQINFFDVENKWVVADLPGFGYAVTGKQQRKQWAELNMKYLGNRSQLSLVCALIDIRHDPMAHDLALIEWLENNARKYVIVLTKSDKISPKAVLERKEQLDHFICKCNYAIEVLPYSSVKGVGRNQLLAIIKKNIIE